MTPARTSRERAGNTGTSAASAGAGAAFDDLAATYDAVFTEGDLGRRYRRAVWDRLDRSFGPGDRVLDLGCGTGEDAVHLAGRGVRVVGVDASAAMVEAAREKAARAGLSGRIRLVRRSIEGIADLDREAPENRRPFDGVISNFGALNCVDDLTPVVRDVAALTPPGADVLLCLMGRLVPWEWVWYLLRGRPREAFRRLAPGGITWRGTRVRYPSIRSVRRAFAEGYRVRRISAIGALLPPPYAGEWAGRHPGLVERLGRLERRLEDLSPLPHLADHFLIELRRL